jgi:TIR domain
LADIFVSYTKSDQDWAFWIGQELEKLGHVAHIHEWEVPAGGNIAAWMEESHDKADHILCVISEVYLTKPYSSWERLAAQWAAASERPNFALPVFVEDCKAPTMLAPFKRCNLFGLNENEARACLAAYLKQPVRPTAVPFPPEGKQETTELARSGSIPFPGSNKQRRSEAAAELRKYKLEYTVMWIGTIFLSSFVYFHFVFRIINKLNELQGPVAISFFISAIAMGTVCSMLGFKEPIQATFITTAPAPIICLLAYLGIGRALASFEVTPVVNLFLVAMFSILYGILASVGCLIGLRLRTLVEILISDTKAIKEAGPIVAARIATVGTTALGLLILLTAIIGVVIKQ